MIAIMWILIFLAACLGLSYYRVGIKTFTSVICLLLIGFSLCSVSKAAIYVNWIIFFILFIPLNIVPLRRRILTRPLFSLYRQVMPSMSRTESEALEAGNVWWEGELFSGRPSFKKLFNYVKPVLRDEEEAFLKGPVNELCRRLDDWDIACVRKDLSPEIWQFLKDKGFFGLVIPKQYGGLGLSPYAYARVVERVFSCSITAATTVGVPGTLGPGELLIHYGTEAQKEYYLPRLARGEEIPCFALTSPYAGSDAGGMPDYGVVCKGLYKGNEVVGMRLNFDKRYITLAPIATVIGLAFKLYDPERLLGGEENLGITCALLPRDTPGIEIGRRHLPANNPFQNGPIKGADVFVPVDFIIGGAKMAGHGWRMLMECLAAGRAICLPASGVAGAKISALTTTAYARIRKQFNISIAKFEGVEEMLTRIVGIAYWAEAAFKFTLGALNAGEHPPVASGIVKYHLTECARESVSHAMDVQAGKAVIMGPNNYLALGYQGTPVAITVEGANILTRCMIIFGQGVIRCHPYVLAEMKAAQDSNKAQGLKAFDAAFFAHIGFVFSNLVRSLWLGLTNSMFVRAPRQRSLRRYFQHLSRFSAAFSLAADLGMFSLGGSLKRREKLSGRYADILSQLYIISSILKRYHDENYPSSDLPVFEWSCQNALYIIQEQFDGLLKNFPNRLVAWLLRRFVFPLGKHFSQPSDQLGHEVAKTVLEPCASRDRLLENVFRAEGDLEHKIGLLEQAFACAVSCEAMDTKIDKLYKAGEITGFHFSDRVASAKEAGLITAEESLALLELERLRHKVISVDDFSPHFN